MPVTRCCPSCRTENLPHRRFCASCGAALTSRYAAPAEQSALAVDPALLTAAENRVATILKADLSGFTAMSEVLGDPELIAQIMNQVFEPLVDCVRRHEGYIDNYAGDMIIAFFGAPTAVEAGVERAVRTALEMRDAVAALNERNISHGVDLGVSTGIATGPGLWGEVGAGATRRRTLAGELGDYAALLEKYTDGGFVGICPTTLACVRDILPCRPVEGVHVHPPGDAPEHTLYYADLPPAEPGWLTTAAADGSPLHGHHEPRATLAAAWRAAQGGALRYLHLCGEPGIGKSRLLAELAATVTADGGRVLAVAGRPVSRALRDDLSARLASELGGEDIETALASAARAQPCLVVLDALDWTAAWPALELGELAAIGGLPLLIVTASRDELPAARLAAAGAVVDVVRLAPLPREAVQAIAEDVLARMLEPFEALWLADWSAGVPRVARHLAAWLAECGARDAGELAAAFITLPAAVRQAADVALDELDEVDRAVLYAAAVLDDEAEAGFQPVAMGRVMADELWPWRLESLVASGLLAPAAGGALTFRQKVVRHAALARLVDSARQAVTEAATLGERGAPGRERLVGGEREAR